MSNPGYLTSSETDLVAMVSRGHFWSACRSSSRPDGDRRCLCRHFLSDNEGYLPNELGADMSDFPAISATRRGVNYKVYSLRHAPQTEKGSPSYCITRGCWADQVLIAEPFYHLLKGMVPLYSLASSTFKAKSGFTLIRNLALRILAPLDIIARGSLDNRIRKQNRKDC